MSIAMPYRLVERSIRRFEAQAASQRQHQVVPPARVITLARQLGSGGRPVADAVAARLGWPVWDRQVLDALASESSRHFQSRLFEALDEHARGDIETVLSAFFRPVNAYTYEYLLQRAILTIAQHDAIIVGRGAHLYLPHSLRVKLLAPLDVRIRNLIHFDGLAETEARQRIEVADRERSEFLQALRHHLHTRDRAVAISADADYDLQVNSAKLSIEAAATLIVTAAGAVFGFEPGSLPVATGVTATG